MSARLNTTAAELDRIVVTNQDDVRKVVANLKDTSEQFKQISLDLEAGKGVAGSLLKDEKMKAEMASFISNANDVAAEFSIFGSNLNKKGIWAMLWKPKHKDPKQPAASAKVKSKE